MQYPYAVTADVIKYVGRGDKVMSTSSPLTVADIEELILDVALEMDAIIRAKGIPTPILSGDYPRAFDVLRAINSVGAAAFVELRLFGEASPGTRATPRHTILMNRFDKLMDMLRSNDLSLIDIGALDEDSALVYSGSGINDPDPFFKRRDEY